jgi:hypothetical protein
MPSMDSNDITDIFFILAPPAIYLIALLICPFTLNYIRCNANLKPIIPSPQWNFLKIPFPREN